MMAEGWKRGFGPLLRALGAVRPRGCLSVLIRVHLWLDGCAPCPFLALRRRAGGRRRVVGSFNGFPWTGCG
jgi:hypothetical protein